MQTIIILILALLVLRFILRGLFNKEWIRSSQEKISCIQREHFFWDINGVKLLNVRGVFTCYVKKLSGVNFFRDLSEPIEGEIGEVDQQVKNTVKESRSCIKNIAAINRAIEEAERVFESYLARNSFDITTSEISGAFSRAPKKHLASGHMKEYDILTKDLIETHFNETKNAADLLREYMDFEDKTIDSYRSYDYHGQQSRISGIETAHLEIMEVIRKIFQEKTGNSEESAVFQKAFYKWQLFLLLKWCIAEHSYWTAGTTSFERAYWRLIEGISYL